MVRITLIKAVTLSCCAVSAVCGDMKSDFVDPPLRYKTRPLWFWNGALSKAHTHEMMERSKADGYFGFGTDVGDVSLSVGFTGYYYTGDFDDTYQEINLGAGLGLFSFDVALGKYDNFDGPTQDYIFYSVTAEKNGFYGKVGGFSRDFEGEYFEAGYGTTLADIDLGVALIFSNSDLVGESDEAIVFTLGKSFDL